MSRALYEMGRLAARRPWTVIGVWALTLAVVVGASGAWGRELEDTFEVPGLDSQLAVDLLAEAQSDAAGLTAQVVVTPTDPAATLFDPEEAAALAAIENTVTELPNVLATNQPSATLAQGPEAASAAGAVSVDGRIGLLVVQYPVMEDLTVDDLEALKDVRERFDGAGAEAGSAEAGPLQVELRGDLFFAFEEAETGTGELIGLIAAVVILLVAFGSLVAMGLPIGMAIFGLVLGISSMS